MPEKKAKKTKTEPKKERIPLPIELKKFNDVLYSVIRSGGNDESKDGALLKRLDSISKHFPLQEGFEVRPFEIGLGKVILPSNERWAISIDEIKRNYYRSVEKVFLKDPERESLRKEVPLLVERASLRSMLTDTQLKCAKSNYCSMMNALRARRNKEGVFGVNHQMYITNFNTTVVGDIANIDENYKTIYIDLTFYTNTHMGVLNRFRAVENTVYDSKKLKCCDTVIRRLNRKLRTGL